MATLEQIEFYKAVARDCIAPDQDLWKAAFDASRSVPGMGALTVRFNPYITRWEATINFSDGTEFSGISPRCTQAIVDCLESFYACNYKGVE